MAYPEIRPADPGETGVRALILAQLEYGRAASPPEDAHALEPEALGGPDIALFAAREGEAVLAIGALVRIDDDHGELKAMHTAAAARGRGLGRAMLARLLAEARQRGYRGSASRPVRWKPSPRPGRCTGAPASPPAHRSPITS